MERPEGTPHHAGEHRGETAVAERLRQHAPERPSDHPHERPPQASLHGDSHEDRHADMHADEHAVPRDLHKPGPLTLIAVAILFAGLLVGLFFLGLRPHLRQQEEAAADAAERASAVPAVPVMHPRRAASSGQLSLPCDIRPNQEAAIYARTSGYIKKYYVDIQDKVKTGQLLAEIDTPEIDAQLAQSQAGLIQSKAALEQSRAALEKARAAVDKSKADLALADVTLRRVKETQGEGRNVITAQEMDQKQAAYDQAAAALKQENANVTAAEANLAAAQANVAAAEADVHRLSVLQGFEKVTAPFDGVVTARRAEQGDLVSASGGGRELFRLAASDPVRVFVNVPQVYAAQVKIGQPATLAIRNFPGRTFSGTIVRTSASVDAANRTVLFEIHFANQDGALLPNMYGQVQLGVSSDRPVLVVKTSALLFNPRGTQVAVVRDGQVHFQNVSVGRDLGTELEITSGLSADDQVVTTPDARLSEGGRVQVVPSEKPAVRAVAAP